MHPCAKDLTADIFYSRKEIMIQVPVLNFQDFIAAQGESLTTASHQVASAFGKTHAHVLRDIRRLKGQCPDGWFESNFGFRFEISELQNGQPLAVCDISRDGFTLLAMGFTGKKALAFKIAYINAFNAMAAYIKNQRDGIRYRCMEKELEMKDSARRGSFHGKGLNQRKHEKTSLEAEMAALLAMAQPPLQLN